MNAADKREMEGVLQAQAAMEMIMGRVSKISDVCWRTCMDKPKDSLTSKQRSCVENCAERYFDTSFFIQQRMTQKAQGLQQNF